MREVNPEAIREYGAIRFRSEYHYALFEYYRSAKILKQLERAGIPMSGRILDAGCGGGIAVSCAEETAFAVGIDISNRFGEAGMRMAREKGLENVSFLQADGTSLPFQNCQFDLVLSHSVIEHVDSAEAYLHECYRVLQPGGVLFLATPPYYSFAGAHLARLRVPIPYHLLLPRRWAFRLNFYLASKHPSWLEEHKESNSCQVIAEQGGTKIDDLVQRVTVATAHEWIRRSGFELLKEDRPVSGFFARRMPPFVLRLLKKNRFTQNVIHTNLEYVLRKPVPDGGPAETVAHDKGSRVGA